LNSITILNPDCEIYDGADTICNVIGHDDEFKYSYSFTGTICGFKDSTAQAYAEKYGRNFRDIEETIKECQRVEKDGFLFDVYEDEAFLLYYCDENDPETVVVPSEVNGVPVTGIDGLPERTLYGVGAFDGENIKKIVLPETLTSIGVHAFSGCTKLETIDIPDSVSVIGMSAFFGCESLKSVELPDSLEAVSFRLFEDCKSLESIVIPSSVETIGNYAFSGCEALESAAIPDSVTSIGESAFEGCFELKSVNIPGSLKIINDWTFYQCRSLDAVTIPNSVTSIGKNAFGWCLGLRSVKIPNSVTSIGDSAFDMCSSLDSITIPDTVTKIGDGTFSHSGLSSITIPASVTSIGKGAFSECPSLAKITILNPDCEIYENAATICNIIGHDDMYNYSYSFTGTICGFSNSTAQAYAKKYGRDFKARGTETETYVELTVTLAGDANLDNNVNIADAVLVMQAATNPDKYAQGKSELSITAQGEINADVDGKKGLSNSDALLIQKFKLGLIDKF
jgi:hypothetical protein